MAIGQLFEPLDAMKVSPFILENHEFAEFLLIPLLLSDSVYCEDFEHKISTARAAFFAIRSGAHGSVRTLWRTLPPFHVYPRPMTPLLAY